jgi:hypothetical protein
MITRTSERNHASNDYDTESADAERLASAQAVRTQSGAKALVRGIEDKSSLGSKALVASATKRASSNASKADAARAAIAPLALQLPGHGIDVDAFAARFGAPKYGKLDAAHVAQQARYEFMREALANDPKLADRAIAVRLIGLGRAEHDIVGTACAGRAGMAKYARCESVLARLRSFSAEDRADIAGMMKAGEGFEKALAREHAELSSIKKAPPESDSSFDAQVAAAVNGARAEAARWQKASDRMFDFYHSIGVLDRKAEFAVGAMALKGTVGSVGLGVLKSALTLKKKPIAETAEDLARAGGYVKGRLTDEIARANALYMKFAAQHSDYVAANRRFQDAVKTRDYPTMIETTAQTKQLEAAMKESMSAFLPVAQEVVKMNREFDATLRRDVVDVLVSAASGGLISGTPKEIATGAEKSGDSKLIATLGEKTIEFVKEQIADSAVAETVDQAVSKVLR